MLKEIRHINFFVLDILGIYTDLDALNNVAVFEIDPLDEEKLGKIINIGIQNGVFFVIDEFHAFPFSKYKALRYLILAGRNKGSGWLAITQFPSLVPKAVIGNANLSFLFSIHEKNAIEYLVRTYEISREELMSLDSHEFYIAEYEKVLRDKSGKPKKFILQI